MRGTGAVNAYVLGDQSLTIHSGDSFAGLAAINPSDLTPVSVDTTRPSQKRSYVSTDGFIWTLLEAACEGAGNIGIRVKVTAEGQ